MSYALYVILYSLLIVLILFTVLLVTHPTPEDNSEEQDEAAEHEEYCALLSSNSADHIVESDALFYRALSMRQDEYRSFTNCSLYPNHIHLWQRFNRGSSRSLREYVLTKETKMDKKVLVEFLRHART